jgi:hypothetical protein
MKCDEDVKWFLLPTPLHGTDVVRCMLVGRWPRHNAREAPIWCISGQIGHATAPPAACTNGHPRVRCLDGAHQAHPGAHFRAKKRLRPPGRRAVRVVTGRETAGSVRFGAVAPCVGGMRAVSGPGRVSGRSARRLGRAGCRRGGGEGPGRVAGIGRGTVLEKLRFGAFRAKSAMPRHRPRRAPTAPHGTGALMALIKHTEKRTFGPRSGSGPPGVGRDVL